MDQPITNTQLPIQPPITPVEQLPQIPPKKSPILPIVISVVILTLVGAVGYLGFQVYRSNKITVINNAPILSEESAPSPSLDPTLNWKTYQNQKYGYSVKYSTQSKLFEHNCQSGNPQLANQFILATSEEAGICDGQGENIAITISYPAAMPDCHDTESWKTKKTSTVVSGINAVKCVSTFVGERQYPGPSERTEAFFKTNDHIYNISLDDPKYITTYDQILSTFKFTQGNAENSTGNTKTYNANNVSFEYPKTWIMNSDGSGLKSTSPTIQLNVYSDGGMMNEWMTVVKEIDENERFIQYFERTPGVDEVSGVPKDVREIWILKTRTNRDNGITIEYSSNDSPNVEKIINDVIKTIKFK